MTTTTNVSQVKVNIMTQNQYDSTTKNANEFYIITDREYLDEITSDDIAAALGYTPYNASNPNGYTTNVGTITGITMNGASKGTSGVVDLGTVITEHQSLSGKQDTITGAATTITSNDLTTGRALVSNSSGKVVVSTVSSTELGYVSGVTSAIQTQLNNKVSGNNAITGATKCKITYDSKGLVTAGADLSSSDVTGALGFTPYNSSNPSGFVTASIQTQQDLLAQNTGTLTLANATSIYKLSPSSNLTILFDRTNITATTTKIYTFELCLVIDSSYSITWGGDGNGSTTKTSITWQDNDIPDVSENGTYFFAFRTIDSGAHWLGNMQGRWDNN